MTKLIITLPDGSLLPTPAELLDQKIIIGSGVGCTIVVPHDSVAEAHVELLLDAEGYLITDLVGGGVTAINGHPIEPGAYYQLETGTQIQIGTVEAVYIASEHSEAQSEPVVTAGAKNAFANSVPVSSGGAAPGSFALPVHPPEVFVPRKAERSLWVMASVAVTFVAVTAALLAAVLGANMSSQR